MIFQNYADWSRRTNCAIKIIAAIFILFSNLFHGNWGKKELKNKGINKKKKKKKKKKQLLKKTIWKLNKNYH